MIHNIIFLFANFFEEKLMYIFLLHLINIIIYNM